MPYVDAPARWVALSTVLLLGACATPLPPAPYPEALPMTAVLRAQARAYADLPAVKALAVASDSAWGSSSANDNADAAIRAALAKCQRDSSRACRIHDVNGFDYQQHYQEFSRASHVALAALKVPKDVPYHFESMDWGLPASQEMRRERQGFHTPTPLSLLGIHTISTARLAQGLRSGKMLVVDARWWAEGIETLPNAYFVDGAGSEASPSSSREAAQRRSFERTMQLLMPDKSSPVAVFCVSAECWLSVNAALRLQALGYREVYWYRGGIEAWRAAHLPVVKAVPHATLQSP